MGWAQNYISKLLEGHTVQFRPRGPSMRGRVSSGALVTVEPITGEILTGDVVLCKVKGDDYLHLVHARQGDRYLIGNNFGRINGWIGLKNIYGKLTKVEA